MPDERGDLEMNSVKFLFVLLAFLSGTTNGQESDDWDWKIAPYLWAVGLDGTATLAGYDQDINVGFSDFLSEFEIGGSVFAEVGKGHHAFSFDYSYIRLKPDPTLLPSPPTPPDSTMATKMTVNIFESAYNYRLDSLDSTAIVVGARYIDLALRLTPNINGPELPIEPPFPQNPVEFGLSWWDAFVGVKTFNQISQNWAFQFYGSVGYGQSDWPWTLHGLFTRQFSNNNRLGLGARVWGIDYSKNISFMGEYAGIDATFYGLIIGYEFN